MKLKRNTLLSSVACAGVVSLPAHAAIINEIEPNDSLATATDLTGADTGVGALNGQNDDFVDWWKFSGLTPGSPFTVDVERTGFLGGVDDVLVEVFDVSGVLNLLASTVLTDVNPDGALSDTVPSDGMVALSFSYNDDGEGFDEGYQFSISSIPEPATAALLGAGLTALAGLRRKQERPASV